MLVMHILSKPQNSDNRGLILFLLWAAPFPLLFPGGPSSIYRSNFNVMKLVMTIVEQLANLGLIMGGLK